MAKALEPSQVIRLPMKALKEVFDENPDILVRVVQIIMIRLQRVIFTALRNYLGLYSELVQIKPHKDRRGQPPAPQPQPALSTQTANTKSSPTHHKPRVNYQDYVLHTLAMDGSDFMRPDVMHNDVPEGTGPTRHARRHSIAVDRDVELSLLQNSAIDGFIRELGLKDSDRYLLDGHIDFKEAEPGITLLKEGCAEDVCLMIIITGSVSVLQQSVGYPGSKNTTSSEVKKTHHNRSTMHHERLTKEIVLKSGCSLQVHSYNSYAGDMIGGLSVLTAETCQYTVRARHHTKVGILNRTSVYK